MVARSKPLTRLVTHREVARTLGVSTAALRDWSERGYFPRAFRQIGPTLFFRRDDVGHWIETGVWPHDTQFNPLRGTPPASPLP